MSDVDDTFHVLHDPESESEAVPAATDSPLAQLRAQRAALVEQLEEIHVRVPRYTNPEIWVRYQPVDPGVVAEAADKRRKAAKHGAGSKSDWVVLANADLLVGACLGVYGLQGDEEFSLAPGGGDHTRFDKDLADGLGIEATRAVEVCQALFVTGADLVSHASELAERSGLDRDQFEERYRGE